MWYLGVLEVGGSRLGGVLLSLANPRNTTKLHRVLDSSREGKEETGKGKKVASSSSVVGQLYKYWVRDQQHHLDLRCLLTCKSSSSAGPFFVLLVVALLHSCVVLLLPHFLFFLLYNLSEEINQLCTFLERTVTVFRVPLQQQPNHFPIGDRH